jgi:hypothetical protein
MAEAVMIELVTHLVQEAKMAAYINVAVVMILRVAVIAIVLPQVLTINLQALAANRELSISLIL